MRASILGVLVGLSFGLAFSGSGQQRDDAYAESNRSYAQSVPNDSVRSNLVQHDLTQSTMPQDRLAAAGPQSGPLIALTTTAIDGQQNVVVIDPNTRTLGTYHVDVKGQVTLKCVRDIRWDLQLDAFNGTEPTPEQIKALLRSR